MIYILSFDTKLVRFWCLIIKYIVIKTAKVTPNIKSISKIISINGHVIAKIIKTKKKSPLRIQSSQYPTYPLHSSVSQKFQIPASTVKIFSRRNMPIKIVTNNIFMILRLRAGMMTSVSTLSWYLYMVIGFSLGERFGNSPLWRGGNASGVDGVV